MNRHSGLLNRLRRLEARRKTRRAMPVIIMGIYSEEQPGPVIGIEGGGVRVRRKEGEPIEALRARAAAEIPARFATMLYGAPTARQSAVPAPAATPAPQPAPVNPWALAGVGRQATQEELVRMGAIPVPPERLV